MGGPFHNVVHALDMNLRILQDQMRQASIEGREEDRVRLSEKVLEFDEAIRALRFGVWTVPGPQASAEARFASARGATDAAEKSCVSRITA